MRLQNEENDANDEGCYGGPGLQRDGDLPGTVDVDKRHPGTPLGGFGFTGPFPLG